MGQATSHALVAAADLQPPLAMGVSGLETELAENLEHERILGSTRFMKTILCRHAAEGRMVLHVFMKPVSMTLNLTQQIRTLRGLYETLEGATHTLGSVHVVSDDRAVYILRQYLHNNIYDRISTRPFLTLSEKRWITYQMLVALREIHGRDIVHGDIKSENIVMTSWNLLYLTDFAPFKPTYLPTDDPAEFNFYFDTSTRQCCCIAPERFYSPGSDIARRLANPSNSSPINNSSSYDLSLNPEMDIFSVGCVIGELFLDGIPLFNLSRLLSYRRGEVDPISLVSGIPDKDIAELVLHMIQLDPESRLTASEYLDRWGTIFPKAPISAYMDKCDADTRVQALLNEPDCISDSTCSIVASLLCSCIRNCRLPSSRHLGIKMLLECSTGPMKGDLDLILPYLISLAQDKSPIIRALAITSIRTLFHDIERLTPANSNIFRNYIVPQLQYISNDASVSVRSILASVISELADTALHLSTLNSDGIGNEDNNDANIDFVDSQFRALVSKLSFDEAAEVRHVLLCAFPQLYMLGIQSLSNIITYLNDRDCWFLRAAFFDVIFAASAQISSHASREYIVPLINLADNEPFVVISALKALIKMLSQMSPAMIWDKLVEAQACLDRNGLEISTKEFIDFVIENCKLPVSKESAVQVLEIMRAQKSANGKRSEDNTIDGRQRVQASLGDGRTTQLRDTGAAVKTIFLMPVKFPWKERVNAEKQSIESSTEDETHAYSVTQQKMDGAEGSDIPRKFVYKKSLELDFSPENKPRRRFENWCPRGTLVAEISEHNDAVTCLANCGGSLFASGSEDGTVRVFDSSVFRKNAVCRSHATHFQGGRISALVYHESLECLASCSTNGKIAIHHVAGSQFTEVASETLLHGEYAVAAQFAKHTSGFSLVAATSKSRVLFYSVADLALQDSVPLKAEYGRPTAMASDGRAFAVVGTSEGQIILVDTRFRIVLKTYPQFHGHPVSALALYSSDSVLVATPAGDISMLNLRTCKWPVCVSSRSLQELKNSTPEIQLRVNDVIHIPHVQYCISASNDTMVRYWNIERLERSYVVNSADVPQPYSSYRLNDTVYYCENPRPLHSRSSSSSGSMLRHSTKNPSHVSGKTQEPVTALAAVGSPAPMLVTGLQNGTIRVLI